MARSERDTAERWREDLRRGIATCGLEDEGRVLGFAGCGPVREPTGELPAGEIYAIYVDDSRWGQGHGRALFERCRDELYDQGLFPLVLWVLRQNRRGRRFYERQGMVLEEAEKRELLHGHPLDQVLYWLPNTDLGHLA